MPDWTLSMDQHYEYYIVNPNTWRDEKKLDNVLSCSIDRDSDADTLGSASIEITESVGECYIRVYLVTIQNGVTESHSLGTFLVQTPSSTFDDKVRSVTMDAYTPLLELKEKVMPLGYSLMKGDNIMRSAYTIVRERVRAPVVEAICTENLYDDFVSDPSDTGLTYSKDLIANAKYVFDLDEMGRILFSPKQDTASLQPVWTFTDDENCSIIMPEISMTHDIYGIPNVVEVVYSNGGDYYYAKVVNDDPNSPISTVNRGREIPYRDTNPAVIGNPTEKQIQEYAEQLLRELSTLEYTLSYTHGYCPVRPNDCVRINYPKAGLVNVKAKVISQTIKCETGCPVSEKAVFTTKLWR